MKGNLQLRPALRYHGGKWLLAPWIIRHFPPHRFYVEPYGGGGSVLLQKPPSWSEVYNDLNPEIVSLFRVLRHPAQNRKLRRLLELTPFARPEFKAAYAPCAEPVEAARRLIVRAFMGFGSAAHNSRHATGFRANSNKSGSTPAHDWRNYPAALDFFVERLRGVTIEERPALELITYHDSPRHLFHVDPPYLHSTRQHRQHGNYGRFELTDTDHCQLADTLCAAKGFIVLSGYDSPLYRKLYRGWRRVSKQTHGNGNCGANARQEILWLNPRCWDALH